MSVWNNYKIYTLSNSLPFNCGETIELLQTLTLYNLRTHITLALINFRGKENLPTCELGEEEERRKGAIAEDEENIQKGKWWKKVKPILCKFNRYLTHVEWFFLKLCFKICYRNLIFLFGVPCRSFAYPRVV